jgi:hypothetical protein
MQHHLSRQHIVICLVIIHTNCWRHINSAFALCSHIHPASSVVGDAKDIDWYAPNGEKLLPNRQDIIVNRNDESSSTLTIYNADVDNAGVYKCVAKNADKESQGTVNVKIFRKFPLKLSPWKVLILFIVI